MSSSSLIYRIHAPEIHRQESSGLRLTCGLAAGVACLAVFIAESTTYFGGDHTSGPLRRWPRRCLEPGWTRIGA